MNINKDSWHVKLHKWMETETYRDLHYNRPVGLCWYFWATIGALLKLIGGVLVGTILLCALGYAVIMILSPLYFLFASYTGWHFLSDDYYETSLLVMIVLWIIFPLVVGVIASLSGEMRVVPNWMKLDKHYTPAKPKQPSLVWEYIKAKKSKVCPIVKLEEK